jgi:hypothetical protein
VRPALALCALLVACDPPPQHLTIPGDLPPACPTMAALPHPPKPPQSLPAIRGYANTAARTANAAIHERDDCADVYARLRKAITK